MPFFFPTKTCFIDDDLDFMKGLEYRFRSHFPLIIRSDPENAVLEIRTREAWLREAQLLDFEVVDHDEHLRKEDRWIKFKMSSMKKLFVFPSRFETISIAVVDYDMPQMNGLEVFEALVGSFTKRVLLTGKAGQDLAIEAFNNGLIDAFLVKQDPDISKKLIEHVRLLQRRYVQSVAASAAIFPSLEEVRFLRDEAIAAVFQKTFAELNGSEYHISLLPPGFVISDGQGNTSQFLVYDSELRRAHLEVAEANNAPSGLLKLLHGERMIPFFPSEGGYYDPEFEENWRDYLYEAKVVSGSEHWMVAAVPS